MTQQIFSSSPVWIETPDYAGPDRRMGPRRRVLDRRQRLPFWLAASQIERDRRFNRGRRADD